MKILVTCGLTSDIKTTSSSFTIQVMHIPQGKEDNLTKIRVNHNNTHDFPAAVVGAFYSDCEGRSIVGGGFDGRNNRNEVTEYKHNHEWNSLPPLNVERSHCAASYLQNMLVVIGGIANAFNELEDHNDLNDYDAYNNRLHSLEILKIKIKRR